MSRVQRHRVAISGLLVMPLLALAQAPQQSISLTSPDGTLTITFETTATEQAPPASRQLVYSVSYQGKGLMNCSVDS